MVNKVNPRLAYYITNDNLKQYILYSEAKNKYVEFGDPYKINRMKSEAGIKILGSGYEGVVSSRKNVHATVVNKKSEPLGPEANVLTQRDLNRLNNLAYTLHFARYREHLFNLKFT